MPTRTRKPHQWTLQDFDLAYRRLCRAERRGVWAGDKIVTDNAGEPVLAWSGCPICNESFEPSCLEEAASSNSTAG